MNVEALSPRTINDVWGDLEAHAAPKIFTPFVTLPVHVRMLGSVWVVKRTWFDLAKENPKVSRELLIELLKGNTTVYNQAVTDLYGQLSPAAQKKIEKNDYARMQIARGGANDMLVIEKIKKLNEFFIKSKWKPAAGFNALSRGKINGDFLSGISLGLCFIGFPHMSRLFRDGGLTPSSKIGGLFAHDIHGEKGSRNNRQREFNPQRLEELTPMQVSLRNVLGPLGMLENTIQNATSLQDDSMAPVVWSLSKKETRLDRREVDYVLRSGLYDLDKSIKSLNRTAIHKGKGWIYAPSKSFKDNKELIANFVDELSLELAEAHENSVCINAANLPSQAFERDFEGPISGLEV